MSEQEPITEESMLEAEIESLGMQLEDLKQWFPAILGKDNLKMTIQEKKDLANKTREDLSVIRTNFFRKTESGRNK